MHVEELARVKLGLWGCSFGLFRIVSDACRFCRPASWAPAGYSQISQIQTKISFWRWFGNAPSWLVDDSYPSPSVEVVFGVVKFTCSSHCHCEFFWFFKTLFMSLPRQSWIHRGEFDPVCQHTVLLFPGEKWLYLRCLRCHSPFVQ